MAPVIHHCYVSALDVVEQLPFSLVVENNLRKDLELKQKATDELEKFIVRLRHHMSEHIYHLGKDTINKRSLHRFMFDGPGFMEFILEAPVAINAHFQSKQRARKFLTALKKTIRETLPEGPRREMFLASIEVQDEHHVPLHLETIEKIHDIRAMLHKSVSFVVVSVVLFTILEFGEEAATEIFREVFGISAVMITVVISVAIALCLKPMKEAADRVVEHLIFKKD